MEKLKSGQATELPGQIASYAVFPKAMFQAFTATFGLWFDEGICDLKPARFLNDQFPEIKPLTAKELLDKAWGKH